MKKMDEMDRNIQLYAMAWSYKVMLVILSVWTFFNCWQTLQNGMVYHPLPGLLVCFAVCVQGFCQLVMKRRMIAGDEEYREPNTLLRTIIGTIAITAIILFAGTHLIMGM